MKIVFAGPLIPGSTTLQRFRALRDLGHEVAGVDTYRAPRAADPRWFVERVAARAYRLGSPLKPTCVDRAGANAAILRTLREFPADLMWVEKGITIDASTLVEARRGRPSLKILGYAPDDMSARHNHSRQFIEQLPHYDIFFTTKSFNVDELRALGCPRVRFTNNHYDPHTHRPLPLSDEERSRLGGPVGFVGTYEADRAQSMGHLAASGIPPRIYGNGWARRGDVARLGLRPEGHAPAGDDYARAICAFDINLSFLRKMNRDRQTARSIEIPACGKMMVTERTDEHQALFEDKREAVFFDSDDELLDLVRYYVRRPDECRRIGLAGRERCLRSRYSHHEGLAGMLTTASAL
jgi:spore maturation protein CgeB